jgi:protein-L-isoaspartate(D-aspartate) O-methyltransferase
MAKPPDFSEQRHRMVERQLRRRGIWDERVLEAMDEVPREEFVPDQVRSSAYNDSALPIGHDQTISQPWVVAASASWR